ncbi:L-idonate 5-dehydrogenase [Rhizobium rhizogenes]|uniref:L-idonate 5-dehydrogenase n=1 Tax=Rhizobium rhizogenes TaxID=359 RepID=UPI00064658A0|nr:L-idonate 5-dehydrogenase [Rhizobium rhizogenes]MDJ1635338.1 L-idonate 5-dehydrogenase [Rhizobium rhizogenes]NTG10765.1 L-idonate 5-dehydrogenase [Rhizobium rhizogenes]
MRGVILHAPKDLRIEPIEVVKPGPDQVRIRINAGGICGSDLHYYHHGGTGLIRLKQPMALGHEIAGTIEEVGSSVSHLVPGMRVAVNPSCPCHRCEYCLQGAHNQCLDMQFMGSAMRMPHAQGGFRQNITVSATQAIPIAASVTMAEAAVAEPLAVCLHAAKQAGSLMGKRVLVTGAGPIGSLAVLVARYSGAREVVATDIGDFALQTAAALGASKTINTSRDPDALEPYKKGKGTFDVLFEASGNQAALNGALPAIRAGGIIIQLGLGGDISIPINMIVTKELQLRGTFRFDEEFQLAVDLMGRKLIDVKPLITNTLPFEEADAAFQLASDKTRAMKVQLSF